MQIAIGTVTYFAFQLALGIVIGKLLRHRRRAKPATHAAIFVGRRSALATRAAGLATAER